MHLLINTKGEYEMNNTNMTAVPNAAANAGVQSTDPSCGTMMSRLCEAVCTDITPVPSEPIEQPPVPAVPAAKCSVCGPEVAVPETVMSVQIGKFSIPLAADFDPDVLKKVCGTLANLCCELTASGITSPAA
jgi:hypothetical protein